MIHRAIGRDEQKAKNWTIGELKKTIQARKALGKEFLPMERTKRLEALVLEWR